MWTYDCPTQPGYYWFYGYPHGATYSNPSIVFVKVRKIANGLAFVGDGHFIYPSEAIGVWMPARIPAISELLDIEIKNEGKMEK